MLREKGKKMLQSLLVSYYLWFHLCFYLNVWNWVISSSGEELRVTIWESCFEKFNDGELLAMQPRPVLLIAGVTAKIFRGNP